MIVYTFTHFQICVHYGLMRIPGHYLVAIKFLKEFLLLIKCDVLYLLNIFHMPHKHTNFPSPFLSSHLGTDVSVCGWELVQGREEGLSHGNLWHSSLLPAPPPSPAKSWTVSWWQTGSSALAREGGWDRDEKPPALSAFGHGVIPQRKRRALAYEKYTKQYNYRVLVNIFPTTPFPSKDQATGPSRSL